MRPDRPSQSHRTAAICLVALAMPLLYLISIPWVVIGVNYHRDKTVLYHAAILEYLKPDDWLTLYCRPYTSLLDTPLQAASYGYWDLCRNTCEKLMK